MPRAVYCHFNGLLDGQVVKYTAVLTPHFLERMVERGRRIGDTHFRETIPSFWNAAITDECCGAEIGDSFIYFKRKWNGKRRRWELEFISITPNLNFHTDNFTHAIKVEV